MIDAIGINVLGSIVATVCILVTRLVFYKLRDMFPARAIFRGIADTDAPCRVFILRMTDMQQQGNFLSPVPPYAVATSQSQFEPRQLTPWVTSTCEAQSIAHVLNVLGRVGKTKNVDLAFADRDYDKWDTSMIILGGSWKSRRAFETCNPYFVFRDNMFRLLPTSECFQPASANHDLGLLQKMTNPTNGLPVWVAMGWRGAGTNAATFALAKWWKDLGTLYGSAKFGLLVQLDDRDGWQQFKIVRLYPTPSLFSKVLHPKAWRTLKRNFESKAVLTTVTKPAT